MKKGFYVWDLLSVGGRVMELNDQDVNWREVAFMLNDVNEMLTEKICKMDEEFNQLQDQQNRMKELAIGMKKELSH